MKDIDREPFAEIFHNLSGSENDRGYSLIFDGTVVPAILTKMDAEDRAYIINAAFNRRLDEELVKARASRDGLREALKKIAGADYRGNRSSESILAFNALAADQEEAK
ncbi:MAG: hypothetical protein IPL30_10990 [Elusimicrobia bacterium]|nr:hypothetical protein [Elusimicrobiota bacterium]